MNSMTRREKFWSGSASMFSKSTTPKKERGLSGGNESCPCEETVSSVSNEPCRYTSRLRDGGQALWTSQPVRGRDSLRFRRRCKFSRMSAHQRRHRSSLLGMEIVDGTGFPGCFGSLDPFGFLDVSGYGSFAIWELDFDPGFGEWLIQRYKGVA